MKRRSNVHCSPHTHIHTPAWRRRYLPPDVQRVSTTSNIYARRALSVSGTTRAAAVSARRVCVYIYIHLSRFAISPSSPQEARRSTRNFVVSYVRIRWQFVAGTDANRMLHRTCLRRKVRDVSFSFRVCNGKMRFQFKVL